MRKLLFMVLLAAILASCTEENNSGTTIVVNPVEDTTCAWDWAPYGQPCPQPIIDSLERDLCILRLVEAEERHRLVCLGEWFKQHHKKVPRDCYGRPINLIPCNEPGGQRP